MNCQHCGAPLENGQKICPECGKKRSDPTLVWKILVAVLCMVILVGSLTCAVLFGLGWRFAFPGSGSDEEPTTTSAVEFESYSGDDAQAAAAADQVVAKVGDMTLTNAELQVRYWSQVYSFLSDYGSYLDQMEMDPYQPLSQQACYADPTISWEKFFLERALNDWYSYASLWLIAEEEGFEVDEQTVTELAGIPAQLQEQATAQGFDSVEQMLTQQWGPGVTTQGYMDCQTLFSNCLSFFDSWRPTLAQMDEFYKEHESNYVEQGYGKDDGYLVDVRHILIMPENGETGEDGKPVYPEEDWEKCRVAAQALYDQWKAGEATEESFALLAGDQSQDGGSRTNGGLYNDVAPGDMVEAFDAWIFDSKRAKGDHGLVKTEFGYHLMYFVDSQQKWTIAVENDYVTEMTQKKLDQAKESYPVEYFYDKIVLGQIPLAQE